MKKEKIEKTIITIINTIKENYLLTFTFITINIINGILLRINTVNNGLRFSPIVMELGFLLLISLVSLKIKKNKKIYYYESITILLTIICIVNSIYYHYYNSFSSLSILANITCLLRSIHRAAHWVSIHNMAVSAASAKVTPILLDHSSAWIKLLVMFNL